MKLFAFLAVGFLIVQEASSAAAQNSLRPEKQPTAIKYAGVYHVDSNTWTRGQGATANIGPDIIFRSDVNSGYFSPGWEGSEIVDEGIVPGSGNSNKTGNPGPKDEYYIDGMDFSYCSLSSSQVVWDFNWYGSYVPCDLPSVPANCVINSGYITDVTLPAAGFCWLATLDLTGGDFIPCLEADGGQCAPGYDGNGLGLDHFGWGMTYQTVDGAPTGPTVAGHDISWAPEGEGTVYFPNYTNACQTTSALGTEDMFAIHNGTLSPGCYFFGGYSNPTGCASAPTVIGGQFFTRFYTDITAYSPGCGIGCLDQTFCDSNPENMGLLSASGCSCASGNLVISATGLDAFNGNATYLVIGLGTGSASPTGVSDLCLVGGPIGRYDKDIRVISGGAFSVDILNSLTSGSNVPTVGGPLCSGTVWRTQAWFRDGMNPSRFTRGVRFGPLF